MILIGRVQCLFRARKIGLQKDLVEGIAVGEIVNRILLGFAQNSAVDHIEHNFTKIACVENAPAVQYQFGDGAKLFQGMLPQSVGKFLSGYMSFKRIVLRLFSV